MTNDRRRRGICEHWILIAVYYCIVFVLLYFKNCLSVALHCIFLAFRLQLLNKLEFRVVIKLHRIENYPFDKPERIDSNRFGRANRLESNRFESIFPALLVVNVSSRRCRDLVILASSHYTRRYGNASVSY